MPARTCPQRTCSPLTPLVKVSEVFRMRGVTRPTGTWTDHLRRGWRQALGRFTTLDRLAHRVYFHWQRLRHGAQVTPDLFTYLRVESRWAKPEPVPVRVRPLGGATVWLRPKTTDAEMLRDTF